LRNLSKLSAQALALLASACTVGPNFTPPKPDVPVAWHDPMPSAQLPAGVTTLADADPRWWNSFGDPELTSLISRAAITNLDVQIAVFRIAQARAGEASAAAAGLPQLSAKGGYTREQVGLKGLATESGPLPGVPASNSSEVNGIINDFSAPINLFQGSIDASWELDLFGKVRRSVEASHAATAAAIGNRDDALVTLESEIASTYARLRAAQASRRVTEQEISDEQQILTLTRDRAQHGLVSQLDVENAKAQLGTLQSQLPQYDQQIGSSMNALAVLLGQAPGFLDRELAAPAQIPPPPALVPIGLPSGLIRRRPDVRAAEAQLHEQTAEVGVAVAQFFPDVSLTGQVGQRALKAQDLTRWANNFYSFGPAVSIPIFQGGQLRANLRMAKAEQAQAALSYRKTVLGALQDVENALTAYRTEQARWQALRMTVEASAAAVDLASDRYRRGLANFLDVLTAQSTLINAREQLIQSTLTLTTDLVTLYKALGGGWQAPETPRLANAAP
jgi:NodT family efflux transporter outer membrane factor (OMF) lipoprotein